MGLFVKGITGLLRIAPALALAGKSFGRGSFKKDAKALYKHAMRREINRKQIKEGARIRPRQRRNGLQRGKNDGLVR